MWTASNLKVELQIYIHHYCTLFSLFRVSDDSLDWWSQDALSWIYCKQWTDSSVVKEHEIFKKCEVNLGKMNVN